MRNAGLDEAQAGIKISGRNISNLRYADDNKLWKILKYMGIPDDLNCLLRNLYTGQKTTVRTGHGPTNWF